MEKIRLKDKIFKLFIPCDEIRKAVARVAAEIRQDVEGKDVLFVCVLNGAFMFATELMSELDGAYELSFARYASYAGTGSTGVLREIMPVQESVAGRTVVLLEDGGEARHDAFQAGILAVRVEAGLVWDSDSAGFYRGARVGLRRTGSGLSRHLCD